MLHAHGGQGRLCGGRPQLQNVEHSQMVPQTGRPTTGEGQGGADPVGLGGPGAPGNGGHGQRQMYLTSLAYQGLGQLTVPQVCSSFLKHPMDPIECSKSPSAARCSSICVTRAYIQWANALHHSLIKFDECRLGQVVVKSTSLSTDLPLRHWHDLRCLLGTPGSPSTQGPLRTFPSSGLELRLCG